jgi:pyridoxamine 5'-phosphate oxidase
MNLAPWHSLLDHSLQKHQHEPQSRYFQIATINHLGYPTNRTVVFRGYTADQDLIKFTTDRRSSKVAHISQKPWGEICWYFRQTREQYRIAGILTVVDAKHPNQQLLAERQDTWQHISDSARSQFLWAAPGKSFQPSPESTNTPSPTEPVTNFCLVVLQPWRVDHLCLAEPEPQQRSIYRRDRQGNWLQQRVNP